MQRFASDTFTSSYITTIGVDFITKTIELEGKKVKLQIWDTAGQERFRSITSSYYRGSQGMMVVYDVTDSESFASVEGWFQRIQDMGEKNVKVLLVGNKCDTVFDRKITTVQGEALAQKYNASFIETSALNSTNVSEAFHQLSSLMLNNH
uniref:Uncharacterized protein n=1 Tax=Arcella intermedia TaxID=1963864 RepID=A0A6B2LM93_9EUKA